MNTGGKKKEKGKKGNAAQLREVTTCCRSVRQSLAWLCPRFHIRPDQTGSGATLEDSQDVMVGLAIRPPPKCPRK